MAARRSLHVNSTCRAGRFQRRRSSAASAAPVHAGKMVPPWRSSASASASSWPASPRPPQGTSRRKRRKRCSLSTGAPSDCASGKPRQSRRCSRPLNERLVPSRSSRSSPDRSPHFAGKTHRQDAIQDLASNHPENLTAPSLLGEQLAEAEQQLDAALLGPGCQGLIVVGALVE